MTISVWRRYDLNLTCSQKEDKRVKRVVFTAVVLKLTTHRVGAAEQVALVNPLLP